MPFPSPVVTIRMALGITALLAAAPAAAGDPVYFHQSSVERERFESDFSHCMELAGGVQAPAPIATYSPNMYAMAANSFLNGFYRSRGKRHMIENVLRTCMADKGYRRVKATRTLLRELNRLPEEQRIDRLFVLATAPVPDGEVLPK